jgi:RHS repeat-associated protein
VDKDVQTVARYSCNAWGAVTSAITYTELIDGLDIASINPFRYRGYYYDEEIGLYYLQSRYYDATIGTFINADESVFGTYLAERIVSHNLFAYADNGPVINIDGNGFYSLAAYAVSSTMYAQMAAMSAAATSLMVSIKAFVAMIWNIFVVVSLLLIAIAAIIYICKTIGNVYSTVQAMTNVSKDEYKKFKNNICVYVLARKERKIGSVFYVGRTKNIVARYNAHAKTKGAFYMYVVYTCTSVAQSRVVEQCVLAGCLTGKFTSIIFGAAPSNRIKGISTKNAKKAISNLGKETADTISLLGCTAESDLLFMMNQ